MKAPSLFLALATVSLAIEINIDDKASIKDATTTIAQKLRALYPDKEPWFKPGEFGLIQTANGVNDQGYYWWEAGAVMGGWIDYWAITGDDTYNQVVMDAMLNQTGPFDDYEPPEQNLSLGNDDQAFWGIAALSAAERKFPDPPKDKPQWLALAQAVFNRQASRWDTEFCNGGLRWQVVPTNKGYDFKNTVSNGLLFQMGARLARYTGNQTYADWAIKAYDWTREMKLMTDSYTILDGSHIPECTVSSPYVWTYNAGIYLAGAAYMYDYYNSKKDVANTAHWQNETLSLMQASDTNFFNRKDGLPNIMREIACESQPPLFNKPPTCNTDQRSFKAYMSRFMGYTYQLCPWARDWVMERLRASAVAAAKSCDGAPDGNTCGLSWIMGKYDGSPYGIAKGGVGEHLSVMELFQALLLTDVEGPRTEKTGTSKGDPGAGMGGDPLDLRQTADTTTADRAGAGVLTVIVLVALLVLTWWLLTG